MAESSLSTLSDDFLTCNICLEIYREPMILSCLHSFCKKCLEKHFEGRDAYSIECPLCCEITLSKKEDIQGPRHNFFIQNLIDFTKSTSTQIKDRMCSFCLLFHEKNNPHGKCLTCGDFLCLECYNRHKFTTETFDHEIATLADLQSGKYNEKLRSRQGIPCQEHRKEFLRYFCETCNIPVCRDCVILEHRQDHDIAQPSKAIEKRRQEIGSLLEGLEKKEEEIKTRGAILKEEEFRFNITERDMSKLIQETIDRLTEKVQTEGQNAQLLLDIYINKRREELATTRRKQDEKILLLKKSTEFCEKVVRDGIEGEIIFLQEMIRERLSFLEATAHGEDELTQWKSPAIQVADNTHPLDLFQVDEFSSLPNSQLCDNEKATGEDNKQETDAIGSLTNTFQRFCSNLDKTVSENSISPKELVDQKNKNTIEAKTCSLILNHKRTIDCTNIGDAYHPKLTSVAWLEQDSFVVVDQVNEKVKQYNINGKLLHYVHMTKVLTVTYSNELIYCGLSCGEIKIINKNYEVFDVVSQKYSHCVPVATGKKKSQVFLLDNTSMHLISSWGKEFSKRSMPFTEKSGKQLKLMPVYPHCFREDELVVSDWGSYSVYVIKANGNVTNSYWNRNFVHQKPGGLGCDTDNNIYIAGYYTGELIVLDSNCKYLTKIELPNIKKPRCMACSESNKLLITFANGVAVFQISKKELLCNT